MRQKDQLPFGIGRQERNTVLGVIHSDAQPLFGIAGRLRGKDPYEFAGIRPGGMGRPAIKGTGVDDIHGGLFGRFVDGYVTYIIAVGGEHGERTVARLKLEGRGLGSAMLLEFLLYYLTKPAYRLRVREAIYLDAMLDLF